MTPAAEVTSVEARITRAGAEISRIQQLGLAGIGADAELDIVQPGTALAEFYQLSMAATAEALISAGVMTPAEAARLTGRPMEPDFLACGFAYIGAGGHRPRGQGPITSIVAGQWPNQR